MRSRLQVIVSTAVTTAAFLVAACPTMAAAAAPPADTAGTSAPASPAKHVVSYSPPDMSNISPVKLQHYYQWRHKMDWLLAPIHTRADLERYLKEHADSSSPLDALRPGARKRFLASLRFTPHGAWSGHYGDLQYLSTEQVYKILALFGEQSMAPVFTGGKIRAASPQAQSGSEKISRIARRFDKYVDTLHQSLGATQTQRARKARQDYEQWFGSLQTSKFVHAVGDHDLRLMFRAAGLVAFATHDPKYARDARMDFSEMQRRHFAGPPDYEQMYAILVRTRQFGAVHKFYEAHPEADLTPFPAYRDETGNIDKNTPTVLIVGTRKNELVRRPVALDKPAQVLILTDPNCHFCVRLDHALQSHPELRAALNKHSLRLTPPGSELEFDTLQQWNRSHPEEPIAIMYSLDGWPMVKTLAVPQIFFLRNGRVVNHISGWGKNGINEIKSDLDAIGLWQ